MAMEGERLTWKKPQKKAKKSITSDRMKRSIPKRSPSCTFRVWKPKPASWTIAVNHANATTSTMANRYAARRPRENPKRVRLWR